MPYKFNPFSGKLDYYEAAGTVGITQNTVITVSADYSLPVASSYFSTIVVTAAAEIDLPIALPGMITRIYALTSAVLSAYPASGGSLILTGSDLGTDIGLRNSGVSGDFLELFAKDSTTWVITNYSGTWSLWDKYATLTVTSPNGGESWEQGSTHNITWDYTGTVVLVKIELFKGGVFDSTISASTDCDGIFSWDVPGDLTPDTDYKVRITAL